MHGGGAKSATLAAALVVVAAAAAAAAVATSPSSVNERPRATSDDYITFLRGTVLRPSSAATVSAGRPSPR